MKRHGPRNLAIMVAAAVTSLHCVGQMDAARSGAGDDDALRAGVGCDPDSMAPCPRDEFVCTGDDVTSKRCEGQTPAVPDARGGWRCEIEEGIRTCRNDRLPTGQDGSWTCFESEGQGLCSSPSYVPGSEAGEGPWHCFYEGELIVCETSAQGGGDPTGQPPEPGEEETEDFVPPPDEEEPPSEEPPGEDITCDWPREATLESCQFDNSWDDHVGHCNSEPGTAERLDACLRNNDWMPCDEAEQYAWCTRRVPGMEGPGGPWYEYLRSWVESRHGGDLSASLHEAGTGPLAEHDHGNDYYMLEDREGCRRLLCTTPLVFVFSPSDSVTLVPDDGIGVFDLSLRQDGSAVRVDWPSPANPWLAIDLDGDGMITSGRELFGSASLISGGRVENGFEALAALDDDGDGRIDRDDSRFGQLLLWSDGNGDRVGGRDELRPLEDVGVESLSLDFESRPVCDDRGNCSIERAPFRFVDGEGNLRSGAIVDIHLASRPGS